MIPKIIHYCWFGPKNMPKRVVMCIESWKKFCPDYDFILWTEANSPMENDFVQSALKLKKYAFVADYIRTWALYKYGGIYMDTDMLLIKNPDFLLNQDMILAFEQPEREYLNVAFWGAISKHLFLKQLLDYYDSIQFEPQRIFFYTIPSIVTREYKKYEGSDKITTLDYDFFYPFPGAKKRHSNYIDYVTPNTIGIHLWDLSWLTYRERLYNFAKRLLGFKQKYAYT